MNIELPVITVEQLQKRRKAMLLRSPGKAKMERLLLAKKNAEKEVIHALFEDKK